MDCGRYFAAILDTNNMIHIYGVAGEKFYTGGHYIINIDTQIQAIFCGDLFIMVLNDNGDVYSLSEITSNYNYQLSKLNFANEITDVACGGFHSLFIDRAKNIYSMGSNKYGQLGLGDNIDKQEPARLNIKGNKVFCGLHYSYILGDDLYSFGSNHYGQLGLGRTNGCNIPTVLNNIDNVADISCGGYHTIILKYNGNFYSVGNNEYGQLGLGHNYNKNLFTQNPYMCDVIKVACGSSTTAVLDSSGNVYVFGFGGFGSLGLSNKLTINIPTKMYEGVAQIFCGSSFMIMLLNSSDFYGCGSNNFNQLNLADTTNKYTPVRLNFPHEIQLPNQKLIKNAYK
jgi:alpha-tubulin suppressor-like RCC1 family protein